jgi:hypothetical protein
MKVYLQVLVLPYRSPPPPRVAPGKARRKAGIRAGPALREAARDATAGAAETASARGPGARSRGAAAAADESPGSDGHLVRAAGGEQDGTDRSERDGTSTAVRHYCPGAGVARASPMSDVTRLA